MTETEWLASADLEIDYLFKAPLVVRMLEFIRDSSEATRTRRGKRKLRFFACACCRRYWSELSERSRAAVELAERFADGMDTKQQRWDAQRTLPSPFGHRSIPDDLASYAVETQDWVAAICMHSACYSLFVRTPRHPHEVEEEEDRQAVLVRDIFGNPFRPRPRVNRAWLTWHDGTIPKLAQAIYAERAFDRLPILADALEDAGCDNAEMLAHCRGGGEHVRGCWVVDLLLGKS